jgi:hypothetical protein
MENAGLGPAFYFDGAAALSLRAAQRWSAIA